MQIRPPFMVSYSITTKCNLKCKHCYSSSVEQAAPDELSTEEAFKLVDDLSRWGIGLLIIDGGEPLCREDLLDILKYASSKGYEPQSVATVRLLTKIWPENWWMPVLWQWLSRSMGLMPGHMTLSGV